MILGGVLEAGIGVIPSWYVYLYSVSAFLIHFPSVFQPARPTTSCNKPVFRSGLCKETFNRGMGLLTL